MMGAPARASAELGCQAHAVLVLASWTSLNRCVKTRTQWAPIAYLSGPNTGPVNTNTSPLARTCVLLYF